MDEIFIGIDLGTTNTLACYFKKGKPMFIKFPNAGNMLPSTLYVDEDGNIIVGEPARKLGVLDPQNLIRSSKTYMADFSKKWKVGGKEFTPTEVATEILREVRRAIIKKFKCPNETQINAVITVPAYFTGNQKDETKKAGGAAGFNVMQIITEPMAAAVAAVRQLNLNDKIFVVDLGGGTFDISVLMADRKNRSYNALDLDGDRKLGGDDFDQMLYDYFIGIIEDDLGLDLSSQKKSGLSYNEYYSMTGRVREEAEKAKKTLSDETTAEVNLINLFYYNGKAYDFRPTLTREDFNNICQPLFDKITARINKFISKSDKFKLNEISNIILAGGSCYIPKVQADVEKIFGKRADTSLDRSTMVAFGACLVAESSSGLKGDADDKEEFHDIISHSLGVQVLAPDGKSWILSKILNKGDAYPCKNTRLYTTAHDNETVIPIFVYEAGADKETVADIDAHEYYGDLSLENISPAPARVPKINVTFSYNKDGVLDVTAKDEASGAVKTVSIKKGAKPVRRQIQKPVDFILLLDTSGSMYGNPLDEAKKACRVLFDEIIDFSLHRVGFITFDSYARRRSPLTNDAKKLKAIVRGVDANGGTDLEEGLKFADEDFYASTNEKVAIIVTDGDPNSKPNALNYANKLKRSGVRIVSIGVGRYVDMNFIRQMSSPDSAYEIDTMSKLAKAFETAIGAIIEVKRS